MISATIIGNLGREAETKSVGGTTVTSFSVASSNKVKGEEITTWVTCNYWGKAGEAVAQYLQKGKTVACSGGLTTRTHNDKTYLELRVDNLKLLGGDKSGGGQSNGGATRPAKPPATKGGGGFDDGGFNGGGDDDIPFITNDCMLSSERWWK